MIYRPLGDSGLKLSAIGFGTMRWKDEAACHAVMQRGLDLGMNYVDTSTGYIRGLSHRWVADAIRDRRDEIYFSSKSGWAQCPSADTVRKTIDDTLKKLDLAYFDMYQIWGIGSVKMVKEATKKGGTIQGVRRAQRDGLVKHGLGFTFHGPPKAFRAAVDTGEFLSATVSYNLSNREEEEQVAYAAERGLGVIIMNPLAGGPLARTDDRRLDFLRRAGVGPSCGALRFLLANRHITTAIVGFSVRQHVDDAVRVLEDPDELTEEYRRMLAARMDDKAFRKGPFCTGCGYCRECPNGFNPTQFMEFVRDFSVSAAAEGELSNWLAVQYRRVGVDLRDALSLCTECGECEAKCPQKLSIVREIRRAKAALEG